MATNIKPIRISWAGVMLENLISYVRRKQMKNCKFIIPMIAIALAGCAGGGSTYTPIIDGPKRANFNADLSSCQSLAGSTPLLDGNRQNEAVLVSVLAGLGAGLDDGNDGERLEHAIAGMVIGGALASAVGALEGNSERSDVVKECMVGRGHRVVG